MCVSYELKFTKFKICLFVYGHPSFLETTINNAISELHKHCITMHNYIKKIILNDNSINLINSIFTSLVNMLIYHI